MGGKGVEPLRTFVHTVLSRARLPFRHPPITRYIVENCAALQEFHFSVGKFAARANIFYAQAPLPRALAADVVHDAVVSVFFF